jgi:hypothetical protein
MLGRILPAVPVLLLLQAAPSFAASLPATTDDVVILAQDSLTLGPNSLLASGQVVVNNPGGVLTVLRWAKGLQDTEIIADIVTTKGPARMQPELFDVFTNSFIGPAIIDDSELPLGSLPLFSFPSPPAVTPGTDTCPNQTGTGGNCVARLRNGPVTLAPGNYGNIGAKLHGTLYLEGGVYNVKSLRAGFGSHIIANSSTTINVQGNALFGLYSVFGPADAISPRCVVLNVSGSSVRSSVAILAAVMNAPNAAVRLGALTDYTGNVTGKTVRVGASTVLRAADPVSTCP